MAFKPGDEVWINEDKTVVAIKAKSGKYLYFVTDSLRINGQRLGTGPVVATAISGLNLEIMDAKVEGK